MQRLFWRAGFGATPREAHHWARRGKAPTIRWVLNGGPSPAPRIGPARVDGRRLDPENEWSHDVLWWLDRMIRSRHPLQEKLTLFWHDHFATSDQDTPLMLAQNRTFRRHAMGSFSALLTAVTKDPAMLLFLSLADSDKEAPNENYARELMELFTLGRGYSERDIRQAARALTGFRVDRRENGPPRCLRQGVACRGAQADLRARRQLRLAGRAPPVRGPPRARTLPGGEAWDYFVGTPIPGGTRAHLARTYRRSGHRIKPVVGEILAHPALYRSLDAPGMIKSPVMFVAGALRRAGQRIDDDAWGWLTESMGQQLFHPPSVAGWDWGTAWLSSNAMHVRFNAANYLLETRRLRVKEKATPVKLSPRHAVARARRAGGDPWTSSRTDAELLRAAHRLLTERKLKDGEWRQDRQERADMCQRVLRHLLLSGPDAQVH